MNGYIVSVLYLQLLAVSSILCVLFWAKAMLTSVINSLFEVDGKRGLRLMQQSKLRHCNKNGNQHSHKRDFKSAVTVVGCMFGCGFVLCVLFMFFFFLP